MRVILDIPLELNEICTAVSSPVRSESVRYITAVSTDTREAMRGDLFFAISGENDSGEKYVSDALKKGCAVIAKQARKDVITVDDTSDALLKTAELYKRKLNLTCTVAVTGSVGKSTTVKFLSKILSQSYTVHSPSGNFNNHLGVPLTVLAAQKDTEVLIVELGMNHKGEISRLSKCTHPNIGIITAIGTAHIGNLSSREQIARAKLEIVDGMENGTLLLPYGESLLAEIPNALYVGSDSQNSDFSLNKEEDYLYSLRSVYGDIENIPFFANDKHFLFDLCLAISTAKLMGMSSDKIIDGCKTISNTDLRQRFIELNDFTILDDSYNASLESIIADFRLISSFAKPRGAFLGDVLELGDSSPEIHKSIGRAAARLGIERLYLFGIYANYTADGAISGGINPDNIFVNTDLSNIEESIEHILRNHEKNEIILFKASHKLRFDKIADLIIERIKNERY